MMGERLQRPMRTIDDLKRSLLTSTSPEVGEEGVKKHVNREKKGWRRDFCSEGESKLTENKTENAGGRLWNREKGKGRTPFRQDWGKRERLNTTRTLV